MEFCTEQHQRALSLASQAYLGNLVHDLRTPLNGIVGLTRLLIDHPLDPAEQVRRLQLVLRSAVHMLGLVNQIMDADRPNPLMRSGKATPTTLVDVLTDVAALTCAQARAAQVELSVRVGDGLGGQFMADRGCLTRILGNLVANAIDFAPRGRVDVRIDSAEDGSSHHPWVPLRISVSDSGLGMFRDELEHLFKPGIQGAAGAARGGNGLGLAICKDLVQSLGGSIHVSSQPGHGTRFEILLVLARPTEQNAVPAN